ncbi:hypothetical protein GCM10011500_50190 [Mucilaginibacter rubeus]|nr:hypothetical protein GCM10011500_50190 [Mucilaginibacter rubeus]
MSLESGFKINKYIIREIAFEVIRCIEKIAIKFPHELSSFLPQLIELHQFFNYINLKFV